MRAGGGVWHTGGAIGNARVKGFQLWRCTRTRTVTAAAPSIRTLRMTLLSYKVRTLNQAAPATAVAPMSRLSASCVACTLPRLDPAGNQ
jgi:hypothetical protein